MTRTLLAGLFATGLGAAIGASVAQAHTPPAPPATPSWSYLCIDADGSKDIMEKANRAGARGWELVAGTPHRGGATWCFRQPSWARPAEAR